jgi:hypothetical protein
MNTFGISMNLLRDFNVSMHQKLLYAIQYVHIVLSRHEMSMPHLVLSKNRFGAVRGEQRGIETYPIEAFSWHMI